MPRRCFLPPGYSIGKEGKAGGTMTYESYVEEGGARRKQVTANWRVMWGPNYLVSPGSIPFATYLHE